MGTLSGLVFDAPPVLANSNVLMGWTLLALFSALWCFTHTPHILRSSATQSREEASLMCTAMSVWVRFETFYSWLVKTVDSPTHLLKASSERGVTQVPMACSLNTELYYTHASHHVISGAAQGLFRGFCLSAHVTNTESFLGDIVSCQHILVIEVNSFSCALPHVVEFNILNYYQGLLYIVAFIFSLWTIKTSSARFSRPPSGVVFLPTVHSNRHCGADKFDLSVFIPTAAESSGYFELLLLSTGH